MVASSIVHLSLWLQWSRFSDDVYTSQVYFLTTHYCYQSIEFNDILSQIRRLNTLLFNVRKNLPSVHTENNSASVIGNAGCRRHIYGMVGWGGLFHLQPLLRGWPPSVRWQAAASSCCCCSLAMLPRSWWWRFAFDTTLGESVHRGALQKLCYTSTEFLRGEITKAGQKRGAACNKTSKITRDTVPKLVIFSANIRSDFGT